MIEAQHTKGPWKAAERGDYGDFNGESRIILADDRRIIVIQHSGTNEDEANTRLVEAAPLMLEALQAAEIVLRNRDQNEREVKTLAAIKYAIARAT
jgi:hypothetical protein